VLLVEDVHWLDPSTLELLARFAARLSASRVLLLLTYRPGADPPWSQAPDVTRVGLQPLHAGDAASLVQAIAGDAALPGRMVRELVARADGVPLFIEELTKGVLEARAAEGVASGSGRRSRQSIPSTLEESLGARLDRLGPARHVAQVASVIGRSFSLDLLAAVAEMDAAALERSLERLLEADLLQRRGVGQARYVFKHALIRDAAYDSLLRAQRHEIHGRVAEALAASPAHAGHEPELIGWHHEQAGAPAAALEWYEAALSNATARSAYAEAVAHGKRALGVLATLPDDRARDERELAVRVTLGPSLIAVHGYGAEEVEANYERANALCAPGGDRTRQVESIWGLANYYQARARLDTAKSLGDRLVATTGAATDRQPQVWAHLQLGATHFWRGEYRAALRHLERAVARYDPAGSWFLPGAPDPYVASQAYRGLVLWTLGHPQAGVVACQDAVARAREANRPFSLGLALCFLGSLFRERREPAAVAAVAAEVIGLAEAHGFPTWLGWGRLLAGWAEGHLGRSAGALAQLEQGLAETGRSGTTLGVPAALLHVAEVHLAAGRLDDATTTVGVALRFAADTGQHAWDGELHRLEAEAALAAGRDDEAARAVGLALAKAQEAEALPYELRAAVLQLRLARRLGDDGPAAARLAAVLRRFDEAADATEHVEAHALLRRPR
jgi:predicted ATPase